MAAELKSVEDNEKREQLALFEGTPVHEFRASLAAAGYLEVDDTFGVGDRVTVAAEGYVSKVVFHQRKGVTVRQHIIVVDAETAELKTAEK